jgi:hypothetical protein
MEEQRIWNERDREQEMRWIERCKHRDEKDGGIENMG